MSHTTHYIYFLCNIYRIGDSPPIAAAEQRRRVLQRPPAQLQHGLLRKGVRPPTHQIRPPPEKHRVPQNLRNGHIPVFLASYGVPLHQPHLCQQCHFAAISDVGLECEPSSFIIEFILTFCTCSFRSFNRLFPCLLFLSLTLLHCIAWCA